MTPLQPPGEQPPLLLDPLFGSLLDLLFELRDVPPPLTIGGGFGLHLKRRRLHQLVLPAPGTTFTSGPPLTV